MIFVLQYDGIDSLHEMHAPARMITTIIHCQFQIGIHEHIWMMEQSAKKDKFHPLFYSSTAFAG